MKILAVVLGFGVAIVSASSFGSTVNNTYPVSGDNDCTGAMGTDPNCAVAWGGAVPEYLDGEGETVILDKYLALPGYGASAGFSFQIAKWDWEEPDDGDPYWKFTGGGRYPTVTFDDFVITGDGDGGTLTYNPDVGDPTLFFYSVKQGNAFTVNWFDGVGDGKVDASTLLNLNGVSIEFGPVSHLTLLNGAPTAEIPLPGALWLFGSALLGLVALGRRRGLMA